MCQPAHSIIQFDPPDDDDQDHGGNASSGRIMSALGKAGKWLKKIGNMFHLSTMGQGHHGALGEIDGFKDTFILPERTYFEAHWWNREVKIDGFFNGRRSAPLYINGESANVELRELEKVEALKNSKLYADAVSIGSLHALRQFLEVSLDKTEDPNLYVLAMRRILNRKGLVAYEQRLKQIPHIQEINYNKFAFDLRESIKGLLLGFTRKRHLLIPEWADDTKLWVPSSNAIVMA